MHAEPMKLNRSQVKPILAVTFPEYKGNRIKLYVRPSYSITSSSLCWDEGQKTDVRVVVNGPDGLSAVAVTETAPWNGREYRGEIPKNGMVVERVYSGQLVLIYIHVCPGSDFLPRMLPQDGQQEASAA